MNWKKIPLIQMILNLRLNKIGWNRKRSTLDAIDRQFLPSIIEIIETPASPIKSRLIIFICSLFTALLLWSCVSFVDIHAVAMGHVQPIGRTKLVQPFENGTIKRILVRNGDRVKIGELLVELDKTETIADVEKNQTELMSTYAEVARRQAAISALDNYNTSESKYNIKFSSEVVDKDIIVRENLVLKSDMMSLAATINGYRSQVNEKEATLSKLRSSIAAHERIAALSKERLEMRRTLLDRNVGSRAELLNATHSYEQELATLANDNGQLVEATEAISTINQSIIAAIAKFRSENTNKVSELLQKLSLIRQSLIRAKFRDDSKNIISPVDGIVQDMSIVNIGQVVTAGQQLMSIVPTGSQIEIEAMVGNSDIGFVERGQAVIIKINAFPFTRYGTIKGCITRVSMDAIDAQQIGVRPGSNTGSSAASQVGARPANHIQGLVFLIGVKPDQSFIQIEDKSVPLMAGMEVSVEIQTGKRRLIEYIVSPFLSIASTAMRER